VHFIHEYVAWRPSLAVFLCGMTTASPHPAAAPNLRKAFSPHLLWLLVWPLATILYGAAISDEYAFIRQWHWVNLAWVALAIPFLLVQEKAGLPHWYGRDLPTRKKWLVPVFVGIGFGLLDVLVIKGIMHPEPYDTMPPFLQPFPYSLFLYPSGALDIEIFYRLIPITIVSWIGTRWCSPKTAKSLLWAVVILSALREPLEQWPNGAPWFVAYSLLSGFAMNLLQGIFLLRYGFTSSLALRLGHYLVWHIGLGVYVQLVEKAAM
jgi:hypothetical protein